MAAAKAISGIRGALLCCFVILPVMTAAQTVQVEADVGVGRSNNIDRSALDESSGTMESVGIRFSVLQETRRLDADLVGDLAWLHYASGAFADKFSGNAAGRVRLGLIGNRLYWTLEDNFGQTRRDLFAVPTPENSENVNYLSTGPDLRLGLGSSMNVALGGRASLVDYQHSPTDTRRYSAWLGVERELSNTARLSANVTNEWIDPRKGASIPSYDRSAAFASYAMAGARTTFRIDAGANRIKLDSGGKSGVLARAQIDRQLGQLSRFTLRIGREFTDSGNALSLDSGALEVPTQRTDSLVQTAQPYTNQYASVTWAIAGRRTTIDLSMGGYDENYQDSTALDRQRFQLGMQVTRLVAAHMQARVGVDYEKDRYDSSMGDNSSMTGRLGVSWSLGRRTTLEGTVERSFYETDLVSPNVNETRYWFRLRYGVAPVRNPERR